jgi:hypothetical protein
MDWAHRTLLDFPAGLGVLSSTFPEILWKEVLWPGFSINVHSEKMFRFPGSPQETSWPQTNCSSSRDNHVP